MEAIRFRPLGFVLRAAALAVLAIGCTGKVGSPSLGIGGTPRSGVGTGAAGGTGVGTGTATSGSGAAPGTGAASAAGAGVIPPPPGGNDALGTVAIANTRDKAVSRLTSTQFIHSAAALVGDAAVVGIDALLPEQDLQDGLFKNTGFAQEQLYSVVQGYDAAATAIVGKVSDWPAFHQRWGGCTQTTCIKTFLGSFLEAAFRRPVTAADVSAFQPILDAGTANALSYDDTVQLLVRATLQAPEFLYLFFDLTLTDYQIAARLSYIVTDGPPDSQLYAAAKNQELRTPTGLDKQVDRLLAKGMTAFAQAFGLDFLALHKATTRNINQTSTSTAVDPSVVRQFVSSAVDSFAFLVNGDQPVGSVLTTDTFVVNPPTASWLAGETSTDTVVKPTAKFPFMGLLTHPATLIAISNAVFGSTVSRGQFIASQMLCVPPVPPPPPGVQQADLSAALPPNPTARDYGEARMQDVRCSVCHAQFESYSFALNKWGGDGLYKDDPLLKDNGPIKTGLGDISFDGYKDFLPKIASSTQFQRCVTDHVIRFGLQHTEYPAELVQAVIDGARAASPSLTFRSLLRTLVRQPIFATR